jgi:hypothetical protein
MKKHILLLVFAYTASTYAEQNLENDSHSYAQHALETLLESNGSLESHKKFLQKALIKLESTLHNLQNARQKVMEDITKNHPHQKSYKLMYIYYMNLCSLMNHKEHIQQQLHQLENLIQKQESSQK